MDADIAAQASRIDWRHRIDVGSGFVTPGIDRTPERLATLSLPGRLDGRSVLDIGCL